jgi:hypothetical protein
MLYILFLNLFAYQQSCLDIHICLAFTIATCDYIGPTSCTADCGLQNRCAYSKEQIACNDLHDWFTYLLILASEKDVMQDISGADIIDRFARHSLPILQKQLLYLDVLSWFRAR